MINDNPIKKALLEHLEQDERLLYTANKAIEDDKQRLSVSQGYAERLKSSMIDSMEINDLTELTYYKLIEIEIFSAVLTKDIRDRLTQNIFDNVCVTVDLEATRQNLKVNLGMTDILINPILEKIKALQITKRKDLQLKGEK